MLAALCWREILAKRHRIRAEALHFLVLGALGMWVCGAFVYIGGRSTSATDIGLLYSISPVLIAIVSAFWLREPLRPTMDRVRGPVLDRLLAAAAHLAVGLRTGRPAHPHRGRRHRRADSLHRARSAAVAAFAVVDAQSRPRAGHRLDPGRRGLRRLFVYAAQARRGAARVGLVLYLSPLYSAAIAWAVLGEPVEAFHAVGALLILPGMWLATRR